MNNNIVWKKFILGELFNIDKSKVLPGALKDHTTYNTLQVNTTPNVTASMYNNGVSNYIENNPKVESLKQKNEITIATNGAGLGTCFYHDYEFVMSSGSIAILQAYNNKLKFIINTNKIIGGFIAKIITKIVAKNDLYDWTYKISNERFDREVILLPCIECKKEDSIWEEDNRYYTLAVEYIEFLMRRAKERREENTIKKYEAERKKYEAEYLTEKPNVIWKCVLFSDLFNFDCATKLSATRKELDVNNIKTDKYNIEIVAESKFNNGIVGYVEEDQIPQQNIVQKGFTFSGHFGWCFYHNYNFIYVQNNFYTLLAKISQFEKLLNNNLQVCYFFAKQLSKIFGGSIYNYVWSPNTTRAGREYIMLPWLECSKEESIIEENGKYYTIPVNYISYIYLSGRIKNCQRLIDNYTYRY